MATDPVATAASNNPVLSTLVTAVTAAGLGDTLNTAEDITVFAPTNDAFAAMPTRDARRGHGRSDRSADHGPDLPRRPGPAGAGRRWPAPTRRSRAATSRSPAAVRRSRSTARPWSCAATCRPPMPPSTSSTASSSSRRRADPPGRPWGADPTGRRPGSRPATAGEVPGRFMLNVSRSPIRWATAGVDGEPRPLAARGVRLRRA